jgi:hypothetical protein
LLYFMAMGEMLLGKWGHFDRFNVFTVFIHQCDAPIERFGLMYSISIYPSYEICAISNAIAMQPQSFRFDTAIRKRRNSEQRHLLLDAFSCIVLDVANERGHRISAHRVGRVGAQ